MQKIRKSSCYDCTAVRLHGTNDYKKRSFVLLEEIACTKENIR